MKAVGVRIKSFEDLSEMLEFLETVSTNPKFIDLSVDVATKFVDYVNTEESKTWRKVSRELGDGRRISKTLARSLGVNIKTTMDDKIQENAGLIIAIPLDVSEKMTSYIASEAFKGLRSDQISKALQSKYSQYTDSKINTIARTESSKASTALTEARAKDVASQWYIWRTVKDGKRVRESHQIMEGVVCSWNEPPSPENLEGEKFVGYYHPGGIYNCRCWAQPVILLSQLRFPIKIHINGQIRRMGKEEFLKMGGII